MDTKADYFYFGYVTKSVGYEGVFALKTETDNIQNYKRLKTIFIDLANTLTPFFITNVQIKDTEVIWLKAEGFDTTDSILPLLKKEVYLPISLLPKLEGKKFYFHEIIGFEVIDLNYGVIGIVKDIIELPQQNILQIKHGYQEILVPLNDDILTEVDRTLKTLKIKAPEGLIDIYINKDNDE